MKKALFAIFVTVICSPILAQDFDQVQKGNFLLGGTLSGSYDQLERLDFHYTYDLEFHTALGYFIFKKFAIGITPSTSVIWTKTDPRSKFDCQTNFQLSPLFRYYFWKKFFISFEPGYKIGHLKTPRVDSNTKGFSLNQGIGYDLFFNKNIALEFGYHYYYSKENVDEIYEEQFPFITDLITNRFKFNIGLQIIL